MREAPVERREQDHRPSLSKRKGVPPQPECKAERQVGAEHRVGSLARQVRRRRRHADDENVDRTVKLRRPRVEAAKERLDMRHRRRPAEGRRRGQLARNRAEETAPKRTGSNAKQQADRRGGDALERPLVMRVAVKGPRHRRRIERQCNRDHGHAPRELAVERQRQAPARRRGGLEQ
jgi:hypothetical protein